MNNTSIKLLLPNDVIGGCMDFSGESHPDVAIVNTLTAFINLMKARGKVPSRTPEEYDTMVKLITRFDDNADMFEDIDTFLPKQASVTDIAAEVERRITEGAVPKATIGEVGDIGEQTPIERETVNLFDIPSELKLAQLKKMAPKDRLIELAIDIENRMLLGVPVTDREKLLLPAIEIVYSSTIQQDWGSAHAEAKVSSLIQMHGTEA